MMKKLLLLALPLLAITFNSCSKDDDGGDENVKNEFTINGQTYEFVGGDMGYYGYVNEDGNESENIDLYLYPKGNNADKEFIWFEMFVPKGNTKLVAGTYSKNTGQYYVASTYSEGEVFDEDITGGTVTVAVSGDIYTITINCTLSGGGTVKGTYKGTLKWFDYSED